VVEINNLEGQSLVICQVVKNATFKKLVKWNGFIYQRRLGNFR